MVATIVFDKINRLIIVESPTTGVTVQELINAIRNFEDDLVNFDISTIATASGKDNLGGDPPLFIGITLKLLNWKVKFEDRQGQEYIICSVTGGNLLAVDGNNQFMEPVEPSSFVTVVKTSSVSAALIGGGWEATVSEYQAAGTFGKLMKDTKGRVDNIQALILTK